jgi:hypothetical protein
MALQYQSHVPITQSEVPWALRQGALAGIVAGIVFAAFEMMASAMLMGMEAFFMPLRMIGAIALGSAALEPSYSLATASLAGVTVHMVLALLYGIVFATIVGGVRSGWTTVALASAYGFALWLVNFYLIAPAAFPWFLDASPMVQFIGHTFFFGSVLGFWLWWSHENFLAAHEGPA